MQSRGSQRQVAEGCGESATRYSHVVRVRPVEVLCSVALCVSMWGEDSSAVSGGLPSSGKGGIAKRKR